MQAQQDSPTTADTNNGHASTHPVSSAQGSVNPNEGAVEPTTPQTNISNQDSVQQNGQGSNLNYDDFGYNNQTNVDPNLGGLVQDFQSIDQSNINPFPNQFDGANSLSPDAAAFQSQGFELPPSQSGSNGWMDFLDNDAMDGLDFDFSLDSVPQGDFVTNQQAIPPQQDVAQQVFQEQPAEHQMAQQHQPVEQNQPAQEQQVQMWQQFEEDPLQQQQFAEAENLNAQQVPGDVDLYGLDYQQLVADLQQVAEFNVSK